MNFRTRFAPSPTGPLHLGHAFSAITAHDMAQAAGGAFLLRIEDIDQSRARAEWEHLIFDDLAWLGLDWPRPVLRQSARMDAYAAALDALWARGYLYVCTCTRRDVEAAAAAPQEGVPRHGPDGIVYPGTCRTAGRDRTGPRPRDAVLRLDMAMAIETACSDGVVTFEETGDGRRRIETTGNALTLEVGDVVLARRGMGTSYHLSVVVDDAHQKITHVVRGRDLLEATPIHVVLQRLLGLPTPLYHHHRLIRDAAGRRLAKRDDARAIRTYREAGATPEEVRRMVGLAPDLRSAAPSAPSPRRP